MKERLRFIRAINEVTLQNIKLLSYSVLKNTMGFINSSFITGKLKEKSFEKYNSVGANLFKNLQVNNIS